MKKRIILGALSLVLVVLLAACQAPGQTSTPSPTPGVPGYIRQMSANGQGKVFLTPDIAYIFIGVHSQSNNVSEALKGNNAKAKAITDALQAQGVDLKDIQTTTFAISPTQQYDPQGVATGEVIYMVDNSVNVTVRDLTKFGTLLEAVIGVGANSINGIQFDVQNKEQAVAQARQLAIEDAKKQAAAIAKDAGIELGAVASVNVSTPPQPIPLYEGKGGSAAAGQVPVSAGQMTIVVDANITYEIK
ncbi:MAG TPA: SIMPL domain-containing protein [Anaerolineales bacterium]